jgi:hypothetical protein
VRFAGAIKSAHPYSRLLGIIDSNYPGRLMTLMPSAVTACLRKG